MFDRVRRLLRLKRNVEQNLYNGLAQHEQAKGDNAFISVLGFPTSTAETMDRHTKPLKPLKTPRTTPRISKKTVRPTERTPQLGDARNEKSSNTSQWHVSLRCLLSDHHDVSIFRRFLQSEFSEENIDFWIACERFKKLTTWSSLNRRAHNIWKEYIAEESPKQVNLEYHTRSMIESKLVSPTLDMFDQAQTRVTHLMENDSFTRFLKSDMYKQTHTMTNKYDRTRYNQSESPNIGCVVRLYRRSSHC